jgi:AcrR family transcriptional regulator
VAEVPAKLFTSMAERKRQLVRDELSEAAVLLFAEQGFEETTVDQIAAAVGVSPRTFFRYFKVKEDVLVEFLGHFGEQLVAELAARPAGEPPLTAMRQALIPLIGLHLEHPEKTLRLTRLLLSTPTVRARYLDHQARWRDELAAVLATRTGAGPEDFRPVLTASIALAAFAAAQARWADLDGAPSFVAMLDEAFNAARAAVQNP